MNVFFLPLGSMPEADGYGCHGGFSDDKYQKPIHLVSKNLANECFFLA